MCIFIYILQVFRGENHLIVKMISRLQPPPLNSQIMSQAHLTRDSQRLGGHPVLMWQMWSLELPLSPNNKYKVEQIENKKPTSL